MTVVGFVFWLLWGLFFAFVAVGVWFVSHPDFGKPLEQIAREAVRKTIDNELPALVAKAVAFNPRLQFIKAMQLQMLSVNPTMDRTAAWDAAVRTLRDFLADEGCKFGDPRYAWDREGAIDLIHEYEIRHWEDTSHD